MWKIIQYNYSFVFYKFLSKTFLIIEQKTDIRYQVLFPIYPAPDIQLTVFSFLIVIDSDMVQP